MSEWSVQRVEQLAPDAAAIKAAQSVAKASKWQNLGRSDRIIWSECQGSGSNPYQVRVDVEDAAYKCSCPSRKLPCKHTLGLLLLMAGGGELPEAVPPGFVEEWSTNRAKRAEARQSKEAAPEAQADPLAKARRVEKRESRIVAGLDQLEVWLADIVSQGLAVTQGAAARFLVANGCATRRCTGARSGTTCARRRRRGGSERRLAIETSSRNYSS